MECIINIPSTNTNQSTCEDDCITTDTKKSIITNIFSRIYRIYNNKSNYWNYKVDDVECGTDSIKK